MTPSENIARQFAQSLDAEDYRAAETLLADACYYECRGQVYQGPPAIIAAYRDTGDSAKRDFDSIEYESSVTAINDHSARIHFMDHLTHHGCRHRFECEQLVKINNQGLIIRIEHQDLAGQREALEAFFQKVGLADRSGG